MPLAGDGVKVVFEAVDKDVAKTVDDISKKLDALNNEVDDFSKKNDTATSTQESFMGALLASSAATRVFDSALNFLQETFKKSIQLAQEAELTYARVEATLQSTGRTAEFTADQLADMAQDFALGTMFDDEAILEAMNVLLRFDAVSAQSLPKITQLAIDMAAALGTDVATAANQLGTALETGLLPRQLRVDQETRALFKSYVELGDEANALGLMTDILGKKFEGQAEKMGSTSAGAAAQAKNAWENYLEAQGAAFSAATEQQNRFLADMLNAASQEVEIRSRTIEILKEQGRENARLDTTLNQITGATWDEVKAARAAAIAEREHKDAIAGVRKEGEDGVNISINFAAYGYEDVKAKVEDIFSYERQVNFMLQFQTNADSTQKTLDDLYKSQEENVAKIKEVEAKIASGEITPEDGAEQLEAYREKVVETTNAINDAVEAQEKFKKNLAFQMLFERLKSSGGELTGPEMDTLLEFGKELGVLDEDTIASVTNMLQAVTDVDPGNLEDALNDVKALVGMDGRTITIYVNQVVTTTDSGTTTGAGSTTTGGSSTTTGGTTTTGANVPTFNVTVNGPGYYPDILASLRG